MQSENCDHRFELNCAIGRLLQEPIADGRDFFAKARRRLPISIRPGVAWTRQQKTSTRCRYSRNERPMHSVDAFRRPGSDAGDIERIGASSHVDLEAPSVSRRPGLEQKARRIQARRLLGTSSIFPRVGASNCAVHAVADFAAAKSPYIETASARPAVNAHILMEGADALSWAFVHGATVASMRACGRRIRARRRSIVAKFGVCNRHGKCIILGAHRTA
jgi:hypothetical protein